MFVNINLFELFTTRLYRKSSLLGSIQTVRCNVIHGSTVYSILYLDCLRYLYDSIPYDPYLRVTFESLTHLIRDKLIDYDPLCQT